MCFLSVVSAAAGQGLAPGCVVACPGCAHRHLSREQSLEQKQTFVAARLEPWADRLRAMQTPPEQDRWGYRDKVCLATEWREQGWSAGLRRRLEVVPIPNCPVHSRRVRETLARLLPRLPAPPEFPLTWYLQSGGQVTLVLKTREMPPLSWLDEDLQAHLTAAGVDGLWLHLNPVTGCRILAKQQWSLIWGARRSTDTDGLKYGPAAFQQVLPELSAAALTQAVDFLAPIPGDGVVDLYCGYGRSLRCWIAVGAETIGVELSGEAVDLARVNVSGATVLHGACAQRLPQLDEWIAAIPEHRRLLYLNPPRTGLDPPITAWVVERMRPTCLAYLSCSAGTLSRDLATLSDQGYAVDALQTYDFFPQTYHVETLALLSRQR